MTVRSVAEEAGVSPETVYKAFGGKPGLMKALWDVTLAGDDQPVAIADRPQMREVRSAADPAEKLRLWTGFVTGANHRLPPLYGLRTPPRTAACNPASTRDGPTPCPPATPPPPPTPPPAPSQTDAK